MSILVKINFQSYTQQQLTKRTSTIDQLIQSLRNYYFIPENITNSRLTCRNLEKTIVEGDMTVEDCLTMNKQGTYELFIDIKTESQIIFEQGSESRDENTLKTLDFILKKLQSTKKVQDLIRFKTKKIKPLFAQKLSKIGQIVYQYMKNNEFLRSSLKDLTTSASNEQMQMRMEQVYQTFQDSVNYQKMIDVKKLVQIIKDLRNSLNTKHNDTKLLKKKQVQKDSEIEDLLNMLRKQKENSADVKSQVADLKSQNDRLQDKINQLTNEVNIKTSNLAKLQQNLDSLKQKQQSLVNKLIQSKAAFQRQQKQIKREIVNNNIKIDELNEIIQQKNQLLALKEAQIKKVQENSLEKKLSLVKNQLSNQNPYPSMNAPKIGRLQDIMIDKLLAENLRKIIQIQIKKPITQIYQLLSYDRREHLKYSLKQNFQHSIHKKRSLLLVALSEQDGKFFGAFTQQKYDMFPESYFIPDFDGCSFLFSVIEKQLKHFKIQDGENSLVFDLDTLIFGEDDLMVNFERNCCTSKFVEGKSNTYNIIDGNYRKFLSDKLISQPPEKIEKGKLVVNLVHYKIYEILFREN